MSNEREFWQRQVIEGLTIELVPGDQPCLAIIREGETLVTLELSEARRLIEVLNVAVGELFILIKDPDTLVRLEKLLAQDVTLASSGDGKLSTAGADGNKLPLRGPEIIRRYAEGERAFSKADLRGVNLKGANLSAIDLSEADLERANLQNATLSPANLEKARLVQANLEGANLLQANLYGVDLSCANLRGAQVTDKQLIQARLLWGAIMPDGSKHC